MSVEESIHLVSGIENASKRPQDPMLGLSNLIYRLAESTFQLGNENIAYDTELWDGNYHMLLLSGYSRHLETDNKVLSLFFECFTCFIKKYLLEE